MVNHMQVQRNKGECFFMDFGGGVISKESIGGNKVQRIKTFH